METLGSKLGSPWKERAKIGSTTHFWAWTPTNPILTYSEATYLVWVQGDPVGSRQGPGAIQVLVSLNGHRVEDVPVAGTGGHLKADLGLVGWGPTLLLCPIADPKAAGFAAVLIGDESRVVGGGIGGRHKGPISGLLQPSCVPGPHQRGHVGEGGGRARRAIIMLAAGCLFQGQHHLDGLLFQLVQVCGTNVTAVVLVIPRLANGVGDLEFVVNHSRESRVLENTQAKQNRRICNSRLVKSNSDVSVGLKP